MIEHNEEFKLQIPLSSIRIERTPVTNDDGDLLCVARDDYEFVRPPIGKITIVGKV